MLRESDMYGPLAEHFAHRGMVVLREVTTRQGRIDVLALRLDDRACRRRRELGVGAVTAPNLIRVWASLPPRVRDDDVSALAERLNVLRSTFRSHLRDLETRGVVARDGAGWTRVAKPMRIAKEIVCCEAKLSDWQSVVRQAYGHRFYATRSFVALSRVPRTLDLGVFEKRRLGLIHVSGEGVRRERHAPAIRPSDTLSSVYLQECAWQTLASPRFATGASFATA
jgi:hypothetical protein